MYQLGTFGDVDGAAIVASRICQIASVPVSKKLLFDDVIVHGVFGWRQVLAIAVLSLFVDVVLVPHGQLAKNNLDRSVRKSVVSQIVKVCSARLYAIVFLSEDEFQNSSLGPRDNLRIIPNYSDLELVSDSAPQKDKFFNKQDVSSTELNFIFWGRIDTQHKGLDRLPGFLQKIHREGYRASLTLIGPIKDKESAEICDELQRLLGSDFHAKGRVDRELIPSLVGDHSIFILPSRHEGLPLAGLEAIGMGLPMIATQNTNLFSIFNGLIDFDNLLGERDMVKSLVARLANYEQRAMRSVALNLQSEFEARWQQLCSEINIGQ